MTRPSFHPGSVILKFILIYPLSEIDEAKLVQTIDMYFLGGQTVTHGQFQVDVALVDNTVKGNYT